MKELLKYIVKRIAGILPAAIFMVFTFFVYIPCSLYLGNINEYNLDFSYIIPGVTKVSLTVFVILLILGLILHNKLFVPFLGIVFGIALGFYVQGNFLNADYGTLNGQAINWDDFATAGVLSIVAWIICVVGIQIIIAFKKRIAENIIRWVSLALTVMQLTSFVVTIMNSQKEAIKIDYAITTQDQFVMSLDENIVMFVVDTLDVEYFDDLVNDKPQIKEQLKDFKYYNNCISDGAPTVLGIPSLLTGTQYIDLSKGLNQYREMAYSNSPLLLDLKQNNYQINIYTTTDIVAGLSSEYIDNSEYTSDNYIDDNDSFTSQLYKFAAFYAMPQFMKPEFVFYSDDMKKTIKPKEIKGEVYTYDDPKFYKNYKESGITLIDDKKCFKFYHLYGGHPPFVNNERMERVTGDNSDESTTSRLRQNQGVFYMLETVMDEMKAKGVYDNSTIIITADHGENFLFQNPTVLIKEKNYHGEGEFETISTPVTFSNLYSTIDKIVLADSLDRKQSDSMEENTAWEDYNNRRNEMVKFRKENNLVVKDDIYYDYTLSEVPSVERTRYLTDHIVARSYFKDNKDIADSPFTRVKFDGDAIDMDKVTVVGTTNTPKY